MRKARIHLDWQAGLIPALLIALRLALGFSADGYAATAIPTLRWPLAGDLGDRTPSLGFGDNWPFGECPSGTDKLHVGIDVNATAGEDVSAPEAGTVKAIVYDSPWAYCVTIEHSGFTTVCWHVSPSVVVGQGVTKGQKIGAVANLGEKTHFHFGVRQASYSNTSNRGALPRSNCDSDPAFPESFVNPASLDYGSGGGGTVQTSWLFNTDGNTEGWIAYHVSAQTVSNSIWTVNPDNDPQLVSPLLDRAPSSVNYLKIGMKNKGGDTQGQLLYSDPSHGYEEARSILFNNPNSILINNPNNGNFNWLTIRLDQLSGWNDGNVDHIRIDPVRNGVPVNGNDDVMIDYIFLRKDDKSPNQPTIASVSPPSWTNGSISVSFQSNDPPDVNPIGPDVYGSGIDKFRYRVDPQADQDKFPDICDNTGLASASVSYAPGQLAQGANGFHVYCFDKVGRVSVDRQTTLYFDSTAPTTPTGVTATPPSNNVNSFAFTWNASTDAHSGVYRYYWYVNSGEENWTTATSLSAGAYATRQGVNTFFVRCVDVAGNISGYGQVDFNYNVGGCGPAPPWPPCTLASSKGGELNLIPLPDLSTQEWTVGKSASDILSVGPTYNLCFWYRTRSETPFGWALSGNSPGDRVAIDATKVNHPTADGDWHFFLGTGFTVTVDQMSKFPKLIVYSGDGKSERVEVKEVMLYVRQ